MDMEIAKCDVKAALKHVIEPLASLDNVAVSVKAIAAEGKPVFGLELRPICSESLVECPLEEEFRCSTDRFHPGRRHCGVPIREQPHGFSASQVQSQFQYQ